MEKWEEDVGRGGFGVARLVSCVEDECLVWNVVVEVLVLECLDLWWVCLREECGVNVVCFWEQFWGNLKKYFL